MKVIARISFTLIYKVLVQKLFEKQKIKKKDAIHSLIRISDKVEGGGGQYVQFNTQNDAKKCG